MLKSEHFHTRLDRERKATGNMVEPRQYAGANGTASSSSDLPSLPLSLELRLLSSGSRERASHVMVLDLLQSRRRSKGFSYTCHFSNFFSSGAVSWHGAS